MLKPRRPLGPASLLFLGVSGCRPEPPPAPPSGNIVTLLGTGEQATDAVEFAEDGSVRGVPVGAARLDSPVDIGFDAAGALFVIDWNSHLIRKRENDGALYPIAGGIEGDGCTTDELDSGCAPLLARLDHPTDILFAGDGSLFIAAWHNSKIKALAAEDGLLRDICGSGARDYLGDGGPCIDPEGAPRVALDLPSSIAFDVFGNLFIADQSNQVIRRLDANGSVTTVCGSCPHGGLGCPEGIGYAGDGGPATRAKLNNSIGQAVMPAGKIAFAASGELYIADTFNHAIRRVSPGPDGVLGEGDPDEEVIETVAGTGERGFAGDGGPALEALLNLPTDLAFTPDGGYFIADRGNYCVRHVDAAGIISTVAGHCGVPGSSGDDGPATEAWLDEPFGVAVDVDGALVIADTLNHRVRKVLK
jgi:DNA-binding beta-propeller fold protein YncE